MESNKHTPSQVPPPSDWWHQGQSLSLSHWSGWKWFYQSGHPSGPGERGREKISADISAVSDCDHTHYSSVFQSLFLLVQSAVVSRRLHSQWCCIRNSRVAITQSLQIFRAVIGYNVAWKWLREGKRVFFFFFKQQIIIVLLWIDTRDRGPIFSYMTGSLKLCPSFL